MFSSLLFVVGVLGCFSTIQEELVIERKGRPLHYIERSNRDQVQTMKAVCEICKSKYSENSSKFDKVLLKIKSREASDNKAKQKIISKYAELASKIEVTKDSNGKIKITNAAKPFHQVDFYKKFVDELAKEHEKWVDELLLSLDPETRNQLVKEHARFALVWVGATHMINEPRIKQFLKLDNSTCLKIFRERNGSISRRFGFIDSVCEKPFNEILDVLNDRQLRIFETRLGVERGSVFKLFDYRNESRFQKDMRCEKQFRVVVNRKVERFDGLKGLAKLRESLPGVNVRYHINEYRPVRLRNRAENSSRLIQDRSPINQINPTEVAMRDRFKEPHLIWELPASEKQLMEVGSSVGEWKQGQINADTIEQKIEANNLLMNRMSETLVKIQGRNVFRGFFVSNGPVGFFHLPGVQEDFRLSDKQLERIAEKGRGGAETVNQIWRNQIVKMEMKILKNNLSETQIRKLANLIDMKLEEAIAQKFEYLVGNGLSSTYCPVTPSLRPDTCFRPWMNPPKSMGIFGTK